MDWKRIPSLSALRAFEATATSGSFVAAAQTLNVTEAALRQHVRSLEAQFDTPLIERAGRGIAMTQAGRDLAAGLSDGFGKIQESVERLQREGEERPVRLALTPAFAETWLIPRLPSFWADHPEIEIDLAPSIRPVDLRRREYDLAIRYGMGNWPGLEGEMIASAEYTVVASPKLPESAPVADVSVLKNAVWLFEEGREEHRNWASEHDVPFDAVHNRFYPDNSLVLSAARAGHGLSVQSRALVETDLSTGVLTAVFSEENKRLGYYLVHQKGLRKGAKILASWILNLARAA